MTTMQTPQDTGSVWTRPGMPALLMATFAGFSGFAVLMPVAPLWAVHGGADEGGAGLVNGALLLFTVLTQTMVPMALRRLGWGPVLVTAMLLLGVPALVMGLVDQLWAVLALSAVRGVGFGILTVTGSAAVAELVEPARIGAAVGAYGFAIAGPQVVLLPLGPWVAETLGFWPVFVVAGAPLLGIVPAARLGALMAGRRATEPSYERGATRTGRVALTLLRPMALLLGVTLAGGAVLTFAPQMLEDPALAVATLAVMELVAAIMRWWIGGVADRFGAERFIAPFVIATVVSMVGIAWSLDHSWLVLLVAAALLGAAYGALQNLTLVVSFAAVARRHNGLASSVWNIGFDLGSGLGSVLVGMIAVRSGFPVAMLFTAAFALLTLPLAIGRLRGSSRAAPGRG